MMLKESNNSNTTTTTTNDEIPLRSNTTTTTTATTSSGSSIMISKTIPTTTTSTKKKSSKSKSSSLSSIIHQMYTKLHWTSKPYRMLPHGLSGSVVLVIGYYLTFCSICGNLQPYGINNNNDGTTTVSPILPVVFYSAALMNSIGAYIMAPTATKNTIPIFRMAAILQFCLVYWSIRFFPSTFFNLGAVRDYNTYSTSLSSLVLSYNGLVSLLYRICDIIFATGIVGSIFGFVLLTIVSFGQSKALIIGISFGVFGLSTIAFYPAQAAYDSNWYECILHQYPLQGLACTTYIYIPTITTFAAMAFLATVYTRKIINEKQFAMVLICFVTTTMILTIVAMEWFLADVSTQKLYLPCSSSNNNVMQDNDSFFGNKMDDSSNTSSSSNMTAALIGSTTTAPLSLLSSSSSLSSYSRSLVDTFDVSAMTRAAIRAVSGLEVPVSPYTYYIPPK